MQGELAPNRQVFRITGADARKFLQGMITNDVKRLDDGMIWAALLTPQGKYLADFFIAPEGDALLLDVHTDLAKGLAQRLTMYKLRSDVQIEPTDLKVIRGVGSKPEGAFDDPRHPALGWRAYDTAAPEYAESIDWDALRVAHLVPETCVELIPNDSYILECSFEALNGVDFRKGCYVGQEVTARMKHKTELRKGLARVSVSEPVSIGAEITANGKPVGTIFTQANGEGIAYLRFDRATGDMQAGSATLRVI